MRESTITLNLAAPGQPAEEITLNRVNQDNYSTEYRLKESDVTHTLLIRHSKEKAKQLGRAVERHNVTYTQQFVPSDIYPQGRQVQAYTVIRAGQEDATVETSAVVNAVCNLTSEEAAGILNWEG